MIAPHTILVTIPANATTTPTPFYPAAPLTPTSTPFQPLAPTATPLPTNTPTTIPNQPQPDLTSSPPTWGNYPGPSAWSYLPIPPPTDPLIQPAGRVNILLLGSDQRPYEGGFRTDTILLVSLDPENGKATLISFPRDLYVYIPGWTMRRINEAFAFGGFNTTILTFRYSFGIDINHYILVNFTAFTQVINSLGGIDVQVAQTLTDHRDGYGNYTVRAGLVHMDGATALWYVRARYTTSDFDRARRQQEVLQAIFKRFLSLGVVTKAPELFDIYRKNVTTDLTLSDITPLLPLAEQLSDLKGVKRYTIGPSQVSSWVHPITGAQVLLPNRDAIRAILREALKSH
ncbi:MAG: LCP family protein [Chloroflexota bacterium]